MLGFYLCFVDFRKPFYSISRELCLYTNNSAVILIPDGETTTCNILAGVLQGDTLAPFLFIVVLDYVLRVSLDSMNEKGLQLHPRKSRSHPAQHLTDLDFADDLPLTTEAVSDADSLLQ